MPRSARSRYWIFTLNNPGDFNVKSALSGAVYGVFQKERGENGTEHFQGYVEFSSTKSMAQMKAMIPRAHFEQRAGSQEEARNYCMKEDTRIDGPWEFGIYKPQKGRGHRSDLDAVREAIRSGATEVAIANDFFASYCRYSRSFREYRALIAPARSEKTEVFWLCGPTGTGKSSSVRERSPEAYWKQPHSEWWDGYDGKSDVVLDDFYGWIRYESMLRILDRYPLTVQVKGGQVNFNPRRIFITSNKWPDEIYSSERCLPAPFLRRIDRLEFHGRDFTAFARYKLLDLSGLQEFRLKFVE